MTSAHRSERRSGGTVSRWSNALLTLGAALGTLCIVVALAGAIFDFRTLVFRSGSMSPEIPTGALAFARDTPANELAVGDVVSVLASNGTRITHRVEELTMVGQSAQLTLKGDANSRPDAETYTVSSADRVVFDVPYLGYVIGQATSPIGIFVGGILAGGLLWLVFRPAGRSGGPVGGSRRVAGRGTRRAGAAGAVMAMAVTGAVAQAPTSTLAYFSDSGTIQSGPVSTYTVTKPAITSCTVTGLSQKTATVTFTEVSSPFALDYVATIQETGQAIVVTDLGSTRQIQFSAGLLGTVLNQTYHLQIRARLPSPNGTWISVVTTQPVTLGLLGLSLTCGTAT